MSRFEMKSDSEREKDKLNPEKCLFNVMFEIWNFFECFVYGEPFWYKSEQRNRNQFQHPQIIYKTGELDSTPPTIIATHENSV